MAQQFETGKASFDKTIYSEAEKTQAIVGNIDVYISKYKGRTFLTFKNDTYFGNDVYTITIDGKSGQFDSSTVINKAVELIGGLS